MIPDEIILGLIMMVSLNIYALLGGADYGGGVWDMLAAGPRADRQRKLIAEAIGPIWEANHVWLILVIVVMFSAFPSAFALLTTVLHIPLTLVLFGIVLRGSAFTFRTYDSQDDAVQRRWGRIFSVASLLTPLLLGVTVGAISNGHIHANRGDFYSVYVNSWWQPFPVAVGLFAVALFAFLAAVYLTLDTDDKELQSDFRLRAMGASVVVALMALAVFVLAKTGAADIFGQLAECVSIHVSTAIVAVCAFVALWRRSFRLARIFAATQVTLILWGWAVAQFPYLIRPDVTLFTASSHATTLRLLVFAVAAGAVLLIPSFYYLFKVFKGAGGHTMLDDSQH